MTKPSLKESKFVEYRNQSCDSSRVSERVCAFKIGIGEDCIWFIWVPDFDRHYLLITLSIICCRFLLVKLSSIE